MPHFHLDSDDLIITQLTRCAGWLFALCFDSDVHVYAEHPEGINSKAVYLFSSFYLDGIRLFQTLTWS